MSETTRSATTQPAPSLPARPPPLEGRCKSCGAWIVTVPADTRWARARCGNRQFGGADGRKCPQYGLGQTIKFARRANSGSATRESVVD